VLSAVCPNVPPEEIDRLSAGEHDARLLTLRERLFGPTLMAVVTCAGCGEQLELALRTEDIRVPPRPATSDAEEIEVAGFGVSFRLPAVRDIARATTTRDVSAFRREVLARCVLDVRKDGMPATHDDLPAEVVTAIAERMEELDPQANVEIGISCPRCDRRWSAALDVALFVWAELDAWARRLLHDVHRLAAAHGWSEHDVLAMSPLRRSLYLDMLGGR